jgi:hypothetical protein
MDFGQYAHKLSQVANYCKINALKPILGFTGGEVFLYRSKGGDSFSDLISHALRVLPDAKIVVKTSGFQKHDYLDALLEKVLLMMPKEQLLFRLGFSLHQNAGMRGFERLSHMFDKILHYHNRLEMDIIYDKIRMPETFAVISDTLQKHGFAPIAADRWFDRVFANPLVTNEISFACGEKRVVITTDPAYKTDACADGLEYYDGTFTKSCMACTNNRTSILYTTDFSVIPCGDPYADFSVKMLPSGDLEQEVRWLHDRFAAIKPVMALKSFKTKREACKFCTKFLSGKAVGDVQCEL